jgi:uncharacterized CHY-type Zn-finger protein
MTDVINIDVFQKYSSDGPFQEPIVKCDSCAKLVRVEDIHKIGMCPYCSNTRVRNVRVMTQQDMDQAMEWANEGKIDPDWINLFEPSEVTE